MPAYTAEALMQIISLVEGTILAPELSAGNPVIFITCVLPDTTIRVGHAKLQKQVNGYPTPDTVCGYAFLRHVDVRTTSLAEAFASYIMDVLLTLPTIRDTIIDKCCWQLIKDAVTQVTNQKEESLMRIQEKYNL